MNDTRVKIYSYVKEFRNAIEAMKEEVIQKDEKGILLWWLERFPKGRCADASQLLAKYLSSKGIETKYIEQGHSENIRSHAWLEKDEYIIDITIDQFEGFSDTMIVMNDRSWHSSLNGKIGNGDFEKFNEYNRNRLKDLYQKIISKVEL